jgi:hypothetical protein
VALLFGQQAVAAPDFLGRAIHGQRRHVFFQREQLAEADVLRLDAKYFASIRIGEDIALAEDAVTGVLFVEAAARVDFIAGAADDMAVLARQHIRSVAQHARLDDPTAIEEGIDRLQRNRRDGAIERSGTHFGLELHIAPAIQHEARLAVHVYQVERIAGINEMRILDLRIVMPELRPAPGIFQEHIGDVPQRIALLHHIGVGVTALQRQHIGVRHERHRQGEQAAQ